MLKFYLEMFMSKQYPYGGERSFVSGLEIENTCAQHLKGKLI